MGRAERPPLEGGWNRGQERVGKERVETPVRDPSGRPGERLRRLPRPVSKESWSHRSDIKESL